MPRKKTKANDIPRLVIPKNATLRQIYAICREQFSAAELQRYTEMEPLVPAAQLLAELEAIHQEETQPRQKQ